MQLFERLRAHTSDRPQQAVLRFLGPPEKEEYSYEVVWRESARLAAHLRDLGLGPDTRVGVFCEDHPRWALSFLALVSAGCTAVPFDILHTPQTLARLVEHSGCSFLIVSQNFLHLAEEVQALLPKRLPGLLLSTEPSHVYRSWQFQTSASSANQEGRWTDYVHPLVPRPDDCPMAILYTSGTTGSPKGVMLSARNVEVNIETALRLIKLYPSDHMLSVLPLYHTLALVINLIVPLWSGFAVSFVSALDPQKVMKAFVEEGITFFVCVPQFYYVMQRRILGEVNQSGAIVRFLFKRLLSLSHVLRTRFGIKAGRILFKSVHRRFGSKFRYFGVGGARFDPKVETFLRDLGFGFLQAYGMTETAALITITPETGNEVGSVGRPLPHSQLAIDSPNDEGIGEVIVRGPNVMQGYWRNREATSSVLVDGWLHTGDSGYISPRGFLYLTGRSKDVIVLSSGKNVYPDEIEHHYAERCPEIREICVVGIPDQSAAENREKLHAVVVPDFDYLRTRGVVNSGDMIRFVIENASQSLPSYKRVHSFEIRRDPLPRTTTRKVKRFEVSREIQAGRQDTLPPRAGPPPSQELSPTESKLFDLISGMKKGIPVRAGMSLELDLGFDSLERIELLSSVQETFAVQLSDEQMTEVLTVADLLHLLQEKAADPDDASQTPVSWTEIIQKPLRPEDQKRLDASLRPRPFFAAVLYLKARFATALAKLIMGFEVRGVENLPDSYPFLVCPNHLSFLDPVFVVMALPYRVVRREFFLGYTDYFEAGPMAFLGRRLRVVPVDPDRDLRRALRLSAEGLKQESVLIVFPEGERSIDGELKAFRRGPSILATEVGVLAVPVAIKGTFEVWPRGSKRIRRHPVTIEFGKPLRPEPGETAEAFNARLQDAVRQMLG